MSNAERVLRRAQVCWRCSIRSLIVSVVVLFIIRVLIVAMVLVAFMVVEGVVADDVLLVVLQVY